MRMPFPIALEATRTKTLEELERIAVTALRDGDPFLASWVMWARCGRVSYRLEHDLLEALLLSDLPDEVVLALPHKCMWIDLEGQTDFRLQGEPIAGFFLRSSAKDGSWVGVASTRILGDRSNNFVWFHVADSEEADRVLPVDEQAVPAQLRHISLMVTFYLMDPAHEERREALRIDSLRRRRLTNAGVANPQRAIAFAQHRILGASYRLPAEAYEATGTKLALRTPVRGHVRMQRVGPGRESVRATWVKPHWRGPANAPSAAIVTDVRRPLTPTLSDEQRRLRVVEATRRLRAA